MKKDARQTAFSILLKIQLHHAYSNLELDAQLSETEMDARDRGLVSALVYGCLEKLITLDYMLSRYLTQPLSKLSPPVLTALRIGAYQLLFLDKIPPSAAVNSSVLLVKQNRCAYAGGLVNAVLRKVAAGGLKLPEGTDTSALHIRYSMPEWLIELWTSSYGMRHCLALLDAMQTPAALTVRTNTAKIDRNGLLARFTQDGIAAEPDPLTPQGIHLERCGAVERLDSFREGLFHVQDSASQLCCALLDAKDGDTIYDVCAAPGGKSFTLAQDCKPGGKVQAYDLYPARLNLILQGAERLGLTNLSTQAADAREVDSARKPADKVLCDVPCSGLGILHRKPEIRYKSAQDIDKLPDLQYLILCSAASYVKPDGLLLYSTCSLNPAENEAVCERFLRENKDFRAVEPYPDFARHAPGALGLTLMPHLHGCDGFYLCLMRRTNDL